MPKQSIQNNLLIFYHHIYNGIKQIYVEAKEECFERDLMEDTLRIFQKDLAIYQNGIKK